MAPLSRAGFQGLFFDRFDSPRAAQTLAPASGSAAGAGDSATGAGPDAGGKGLAADSAGASATVTGLYYARNRFYSPELGRFDTRDVNATALPIITALVFNAEAAWILLDSVSADGLYFDGMNLYGFAGGNPVRRHDALGLCYFDLAITSGYDASIDAGEAAVVTGMAALLYKLLGDAYQSMQWGVTGMSAAFDMFVQGVAATMSGAYSIGESLMQAAEIAVFATATAQAMKRIVSLSARLQEHATKLATGGPDDPRNNAILREMRA